MSPADAVYTVSSCNRNARFAPLAEVWMPKYFSSIGGGGGLGGGGGQFGGQGIGGGGGFTRAVAIGVGIVTGGAEFVEKILRPLPE
jgi:hypothetical protein